MFEWIAVQKTPFTNAKGIYTEVKLLHENNLSERYYTIQTDGKDLDLITFEQLGSEAESLRLLEQNNVALTEYDFDMSKIPKLNIPL